MVQDAKAYSVGENDNNEEEVPMKALRSPSREQQSLEDADDVQVELSPSDVNTEVVLVQRDRYFGA